mgnify:CR=1 FL=1
MAVTIKGSTGVQLDDNDKQQFGTDDDLEISFNGTNGWIDCNAGSLYIDTTANIVARVNNNEDAIKAVANGAVELYHNNTKQCETSATGLAFPSGKGIDFSAQTATSATGASTTSELLDHYEEGTWTPVARTYNGSAWVDVSYTTSPTTLDARYTKIGRFVQVTLRMAGFQMNTSGVAYPLIAGLPFAANSYQGSGSVAYQSNVFSSVQAGAQTSGSQLEFYVGANWNSWSNGASAQLSLAAHYMV